MQLFSGYRPLVLLSLLAGFALWAFGDHRLEPNPWHWAVIGLIAIVALVPRANQVIPRLLDRFRKPTPRVRTMTTVGVFVVATAYLTGTALWHDRALVPRCHDEHSYCIQTQLVAHGKLWQPPHELADFFESFHILTEPVYASIYFPGTALLNAPGVWLGLPVWVLPSVMAGLVVALAYRIVAEALDGVSGLLAALLTLAPFWFRAYSTVVMSQVPAALLGLATVWAWLHWRHSRHWAWALLIGAFAGWGAITRPADALAFALPVGVAMLLALRTGPFRAWPRAAIPILVGAAPFLSLQIVFNRGTTGDPFLSPYVLYLRHSQPNTAFGYHPFDPTLQPDTGLEQKRAYYNLFMNDVIRLHQVGGVPREVVRRFWVTADVVIPIGVLIVLLPVGVIGALSMLLGGMGVSPMRSGNDQEHGRDAHAIEEATSPLPESAPLTDRAPALVVAGVIPLFFLLYLPNTFYLEHYVIPLIVPTAFLLALGVRVLSSAWEGAVGRALTVFTTAAVVALAVAALPEFNDVVVDEFFTPDDTLTVDRATREAIDGPAVLLVKFRPGDDPHDEPVYNWTVPWPDDARVVRAHDLGPRNAEIIRYYAERQPERQFFRFDRRNRALQPLGRADELWAALRQKPATPATATSPN